MTNEEVHSIEVGDKLYVDHKIHKRIFDGKWHTAYKPDNFYTVFEIDKTKDYIKLTTASELGLNKLVVGNVFTLLYMQHFKLLKKIDYELISSIDYFAQI